MREGEGGAVSGDGEQGEFSVVLGVVAPAEVRRVGVGGMVEDERAL